MPKNPNVKRVLVIGSGPIVIGQAAEFDYAGTQACRSLKEEGMEVILVNSNPATIMTDGDIADKVYIEPLTVRVLEEIIRKEKPDSLLPNMGGQAGLNLGMELDESGFLAAHGVTLLGTTAKTIRKAEDRLEFKETMERTAWRLRIRSDTRWCCARPIRWVAPAVVSPITRLNWRRFWLMVCGSPGWDRFWWNAASQDGKRLSMR